MKLLRNEKNRGYTPLVYELINSFSFLEDIMPRWRDTIGLADISDDHNWPTRFFNILLPTNPTNNNELDKIIGAIIMGR